MLKTSCFPKTLASIFISDLPQAVGGLRMHGRALREDERWQGRHQAREVRPDLERVPDREQELEQVLEPPNSA